MAQARVLPQGQEHIMARTIRSRSGAALATVVFVGGISACAGDPESTDSAAVVDSAAESDAAESDAAAQSTMAPVEPGGDVSADELVQRLSAPGEDALGAFDFTLNFVDGTEDLAAAGSVDLNGASPAAQLSLDVPPMGALDVRLVDGNAYVNIPELTPEGKFFKVPADELGDFGVTDVTDSLDLNSMMDQWTAGSPEITFVGAEDVNGATTDHYEITIDAEAALDAVGETAPADVDLSEAVTTGIWVGQDDHLAKMVIGIDGGSATVNFDNWGSDVTIEAPAAADLMEFTF